MTQDRPVVIGAGLAGLMTALRLAPQKVLVLAAAPLGEEAASAWAQGGLAAAIGADDGIGAHVADTLAAGAGLCDPAAVRRIVGAGPAVVEELARLGARFDRAADGSISLGLEAGHSARRIVHAAGDASGREILRAVIAAALAAPHIDIRAPFRALRLAMHEGAVAGVLGLTEAGPALIPASRVVIATGGAGGLYLHTTNPRGATGQGLAMAARAGAALADIEFVQFHPTALDAGLDPMPLISEAVRGEGAILIDETGTRFMDGAGRAELEPRDIVARAVWARLSAGHRVFLDARACLGDRFGARFPAIAALCAAAGVDPAREPIPVRPAAHYTMGGILTDARGRATIPGLWAAGEAACTGLHGANRLASNSLLEAAVTGAAVAADIAGTSGRRLRPLALPALPPAPDAAPVRPILSAHAGVLRDAPGLAAAAAALRPLACGQGPEADPALLGLMMVAAMRARAESRGGHARTDAPGLSAPMRQQALWDAAAGAAILRPMPLPARAAARA